MINEISKNMSNINSEVLNTFQMMFRAYNKAFGLYSYPPLFILGQVYIMFVSIKNNFINVADLRVYYCNSIICYIVCHISNDIVYDFYYKTDCNYCDPIKSATLVFEDKIPKKYNNNDLLFIIE